MNKPFSLAIAALALAMSASAFTVTGVSAHQRWPWNNFVDINFTIGDAAADTLFKIEVKASFAGGDRVIEAKTFVTDPVAKPGPGRVTWDLGKDFPGLKAVDLRVAVTATPFNTATTPVYMVVDLSGGKNAASYPVRYSTADPVHTPKANDACKTTELWLRRIHPNGAQFILAGTITPSDSNDNFYCKLTKDYYIAVFETTQQQWYQLNEQWASDMSNETWRATRPFDSFYPSRLFGNNGWKWPDDKSVASSSVLGRLRAKTGLAFNLPTEAQWQFAANGGTVGDYVYRDPQGSKYTYGDVARYVPNAGTNNIYIAGGGWNGLCDADSGSACVGTYAPNAYGLYDMIGNVTEDCADPYVTTKKMKTYYIEQGYTFPLVDPEGLPRATAQELNSNALRIVKRGGSWRSTGPTLVDRDSGFQNYTADNHDKYPFSRGFRLCVPCE